MPGIYSRDNFATGLQNAIEAALRRREAYVQRDNARRDANVKAITNFMDEVGRSAESGADQRDKLAALEAERNEILKAQEDRNQAVMDANERSLAAEQLMQGYRPGVIGSDYEQAMRGYHPAMPTRQPKLPEYDGVYDDSTSSVEYSLRRQPDYDYLSAMQGFYRRNR